MLEPHDVNMSEVAAINNATMYLRIIQFIYTCVTYVHWWRM